MYSREETCYDSKWKKRNWEEERYRFAKVLEESYCTRGQTTSTLQNTCRTLDSGLGFHRALDFILKISPVPVIDFTFDLQKKDIEERIS